MHSKVQAGKEIQFVSPVFCKDSSEGAQSKSIGFLNEMNDLSTHALHLFEVPRFHFISIKRLRRILDEGASILKGVLLILNNSFVNCNFIAQMNCVISLVRDLSTPSIVVNEPNVRLLSSRRQHELLQDGLATNYPHNIIYLSPKRDYFLRLVLSCSFLSVKEHKLREILVRVPAKELLCLFLEPVHDLMFSNICCDFAVSICPSR